MEILAVSPPPKSLNSVFNFTLIIFDRVDKATEEKKALSERKRERESEKKIRERGVARGEKLLHANDPTQQSAHVGRKRGDACAARL